MMKHMSLDINNSLVASNFHLNINALFILIQVRKILNLNIQQNLKQILI